MQNFMKSAPIKWYTSMPHGHRPTRLSPGTVHRQGHQVTHVISEEAKALQLKPQPEPLSLRGWPRT